MENQLTFSMQTDQGSLVASFGPFMPIPISGTLENTVNLIADTQEKIDEANTAANNALTANNEAQVARTEAHTSASSAQASATASQKSANDSQASATASQTSATASATSASQASTSATNAATQATNAASSASSAAGNATSVAAVLASMNSIWLGAHATDPTKDNNGNPLTVGCEYLNTTATPPTIRVYTADGWQDQDKTAEDASANATLAAGQASASASSAADSAADAATSANSASSSASTATTKASDAAASAASSDNARSQAETAKNLAQAWASQEAGSPDGSTLLSAKQYAKAAADSAATVSGALQATNNLSELAATSASARANLGLGNVDNTSDANKPISTATQAALNAKFATAGGTISGATTINNTLTVNNGSQLILNNPGVMASRLTATTQGLSVTNSANNAYNMHVRDSDGSVIARGNVYTAGGGNGILDTTGNVYGTAWGGWLSTWLSNNLATRVDWGSYNAAINSLNTTTVNNFNALNGGKISKDVIDRAGWDGGDSNHPYMATNANAISYLMRKYDKSLYWMRRANGYIEFSSDAGGIGCTYFSSDARKKENIVPSVTSALDVLDQFEFYSFNFKDGVGQDPTMTHRIGVMAQQIQPIDPTFVSELSDGSLMPNIVPLLNVALKAIQELRAEVAELKDRASAMRPNDSR